MVVNLTVQEEYAAVQDEGWQPAGARQTAKLLGITVSETILVRAKNASEQSDGGNNERLQ